MAIRYLDEPTTAQPQAAQPAGRIRYLDDTEPADFEQFAQPDPIRATPRLPMEEGTPTTSSSAFAPLEAQEAPRPALSERAKLGARVGFAESGMGLLARTPAGQTLKDLPAGLGLGTDVTGGLFRLFDVPTNAQETVALRQEFENMPNAKNAAEFAATGVGILGGGMASPENFVPIGRGATLLRSAARTGAVTGGLNALVDIGRQELDINQGIQDDFSFASLLANAGIGAVAGGLVHLSLAGLGTAVQRFRAWRKGRKLTPQQAAEADAFEQTAQAEMAKRAQADATPTRFDEDPRATAALKDIAPEGAEAPKQAVTQPEPAKLADIGSEAAPQAAPIVRDYSDAQVQEIIGYRKRIEKARASGKNSIKVAGRWLTPEDIQDIMDPGWDRAIAEQSRPRPATQATEQVAPAPKAADANPEIATERANLDAAILMAEQAPNKMFEGAPLEQLQAARAKLESDPFDYFFSESMRLARESMRARGTPGEEVARKLSDRYGEIADSLAGPRPAGRAVSGNEKDFTALEVYGKKYDALTPDEQAAADVEIEGRFGQSTPEADAARYNEVIRLLKTAPENERVLLGVEREMLKNRHYAGKTPPEAPAPTEAAAAPRAAETAAPVADEPTVPATAPAPKGDYTVKDWIADIDSGKKLEDLPNPSIRGMAELKLRDKKLKDLGSAGRFTITPDTTTAGGALVGGVGGAGYGITQGDTPEERIKNAFAFGAAGAAIGAGGGRGFGKLATTKPGHNVGKRLGVIEDFPVLNKDISNTRIQLQRIGGILMRGSRLRKPFFDAMRRTEADIGSMTDEAKIILSDARGKINANTTKGPQREALEVKLNEVFGDITKIGELPEYLQPVANRIHQIRLKGATRIAALEGITDATRDTVLENGGDYLARKYAIFNLRNGLEARAYRESLPKEDINAALDAIQESWKPKPKTKEQQKLAADMLEQVANDRTNAVAVIKSLRQWMTDDDAARMAAWIAWGKQSGSDVGRRMRSLYNELINPTEVSRDEARSLLDEFLDRDTLAGFTLGRKQIGGKDVTSLYRKKEIDPRLRKVLGEIKDPLANAYQSIENQANIIGRDKQQREFIRIGEAMGIMTRDPDVALEKGMRPFVESGTKLNNPYDNYDGVFIYPWLRDEFKGSVIQADEIPKAGDVALKSLKSATALFKWLKLIPAPDSRSVNLIGAYWNNAVNGRGINPVNGRTLDGVKSVFLANGLMTPDGSPNAARLLALREKLIRHRVLDESVLGRDFIENTRRSFAGQLFGKLDETAQREIDSPLARKAYMGGKFVASGREFAAGDDIFRVAGFLAEANRYKRAFPNLPEAEIEELAGRVLNQTGMTYSEVPYALRELSQLGVVEPFVSFPYSVFRSTANTARLGAAEMADGLATGNTELAKIGATRLTALGIGATLASGYGLSRALNEKHDVTPEQEEAAKLFGPDYIKDSPLAFDSKIENGKATFVQMNYLLPTSLVTEAIEEGLKKAAEDGPVAGVGAGVRSTASQFTGMLDDSRQQVPPVPRTIGLALGLLNEDSFGRPIYNPEDPDKWKKIAGTIGYDWSPGFWSKAVRLYKANNPAAQDPNSPRVYSNSEEFMRFLGRRATTVDAKTVLPSKAYQLNQDYQNATRLYQEAVRKTGTEGPEAVAAYAETQGVITEKFNEMVEMRDAARLLGMNDDTITAGFLRGGLSKRLTGQVMQSINIPPPKEALDARIEKRDAQRKAYREIGGDASGDARGLVSRIRAQNLPPDQFLKALEAEWRASRIGMDANGRMTREFADALKAEIERTK